MAASKPTKGKFMDVLGAADSDEDSSSGSESEGSPEDEEDTTAAAKKQKKEITIEDLQRAGFKGTTGVTHIKEKVEEQNNWDWGDGKAAKLQEEEETAEERRATRLAATQGVDQTAMYAQAALLNAERMREERRLEKERLLQDKKLSVSQKEKRKRDEGKQSRGKSYVEEEKRLQRQFGVYSGFDT